RHDQRPGKAERAGDGAQQIEEMRTFVIEQAEGELVDPGRQPPAGIAELDRIDAANLAKRAALEIGEKLAGRARELEIMDDAERPAAGSGGIDQGPAFGGRHGKGPPGQYMLAARQRLAGQLE